MLHGRYMKQGPNGTSRMRLPG